jgi:hypothetical protein
MVKQILTLPGGISFDINFLPGDRAYHRGRGAIVDIVDLQIAGSTLQYRWAAEGVQGLVSNNELGDLSESDEIISGEAVKINSATTTQIKKLILYLAPSLPRGDDIKNKAGAYSRAIVKEISEAGEFKDSENFVGRMGEKFTDIDWSAISLHLSYSSPDSNDRV